jgi:uncharacterized membrane protein YccC
MDREAQISILRRIAVQAKLALGSAIATVLGLTVGLLIPGDGNAGHLLIIVVCGLCGWIFWLRRGKSLLATIGICLVLILFSYPVALELRDMTHVLMPGF